MHETHANAVVREDTTPPSMQQSNFKYHGTGSELGLLILKNVFLTLITIGLYYPWGKTALRKYLWSHTSLDGHRFQFTGTGKEIFIGYLKVLGVYVSFVILNVATRSHTMLNGIIGFGFFLLFLWALPYLAFGSHRYVMSRTKLRGVSFRVDASQQKSIIRLFYKNFLFSVLSLGLYIPVLQFQLAQGLIRATRYGDKPFHQDGKAKDEWIISITNILGMIFTAYLYTPWAIVRKLRYRLRHVRIDDARLETSITGLGLLGVMLLSLLGTILTLGVAAPWIKTFINAYFLKHISLVGNINYDETMMVKSSGGDASGDAGSDVFDVDMGVF
ncbi:YjgN family protein [Pseudobacteriovorax antillogorgiicola]|uniref:Uncharacterized membrane protein YjgN, DUF898 family n=1 Tax=Pseudobacteriovorax antillogorgiicola TaxID=1513793 RepID=A0A1Y6BRF3_9BACT|nr:DUF898 family protein [Pseudobacteriovorax antillogorgiicola]TCS54638.1 uncharacterized membrane protein YjgN (DUF898 family) [Pseudobacteriovorax antillogorgiicola]SMF17065.1 Uncharacterized membrane protein YjgN, DUF898 family [Pseudobacteriovorax antillogorgiicola]